MNCNGAPYIRKIFLHLAWLVFLFGAYAPRTAALDIDKSLGQCRLDIWTRRDGLPARKIEALTQDPNGFIWMATRGGVVRFDGTTFRIFNYQNTAHFFRDMAVSIASTRDGQLFVGTDGAGCGILKDNDFHRLSFGTGRRQWCQQNVIFSARDGSVWTGGQGQYPLVHINGQQVEAFLEKTPQGELAQGTCGFAEDRSGRLWMLSWSGLCLLQPDGKFHRVTEIPDPAAICGAPEGGLWIGSKQGLYRFQNGAARRYTVAEGLPSNEIHSLCVDHDRNLWIGTSAGLSRLARGRFTTFSHEDGLADPNVGPILEDKEGSLWVATETGLNRFNHTKLVPIEFRTAKGATAQLHAPCEAADGSIVFPTSDGLFHVHGYDAERIGKDMPFRDIKCVAIASDGSLYLLNSEGDLFHYSHGLCRLLAHGNSLEAVWTDHTSLVAIAHDNLLYRLVNGHLKSFHKLPDGWTFSHCVDHNGTLWLGSTLGLIRIQGQRVEIFRRGLPEDTHVLSVAEGTSGDMWLGTDHGLARFRAGSFRLYSTPEGLPDNNIYVAEEDHRGSLWLGGTRGIFTIKLSDLEALESGLIPKVPFVLYDDTDGIRSYPVLGAKLRTRDGRLWFVGEKGATVADPDRLRKNRCVPNVLLEMASADGAQLQLKREERIHPGASKLEFRYTALSLAAPEKVLFRFRLVGYDKNWVEAGTRRAAYYTNLPPGAYTFEVTACNNDGVWSAVGASYHFTIEPAFFQTIWFAILCLVVSAGLIWLIVYLRSGQLRRHNHFLEERVARRTAQLHASVEELRVSKLCLEEANTELQASREELVAFNQELTAMNEELGSANARLEALATTDAMTGIANHRAFQDQMRATIARSARVAAPLTLLLCDVDCFKLYNDSFGHPAGDEVLRSVAQVLKDNIREGDFVARYGGEEFAVLLPCTEVSEALEVAERLRRAVEEYTFAHRKVTLSIGVSASMRGSILPQALVESADQALYAAKHSGRNRVVLSGTMNTLPDNSLPASNRPIQDVPQSAEMLEYDQILAGLLALLELRDTETKGHSQRVARYSMHLALQVQARGIYTFSPQELRDIEMGALLHDLGKVGIPDAILYKPGALTAEEREIMQQHPVLGEEVIRTLAPVADVRALVRSHHERWDGSGYPDGLSGDAIPLSARIFALADALDAMSTNRPYREALPHEAIREEIKRMAGTQFDPALVEIFLRITPRQWAKLALEDRPANATESVPPFITFQKVA